MTKKSDIPDVVVLNSEALGIIRELQEKQNKGEQLDQRAIEALKAINIASNAIDSIMSGRQIDLAFFRRASADIIRRINGDQKPEQPAKRVKKKRKLYFTEKN